MDLSTLSDADLAALHTGDLSKLSDNALVSLRGASGASAAPPPNLAAEETGPGEAALIGAGRTFDRLSKGAQQLYYETKARLEPATLSSAVSGMTPAQQKLAQLKIAAADDDAAYKPLQEAHPITTGIGEAAPSMVIPAGGGASLLGTLGRLAVAGAAPGLLEYGTAGERATRGAEGAAAGAVGGVVVPKVAQAVGQALPALGRTASALLEPLTEGGRNQIVGRALNAAAGNTSPSVGERLLNAAPLLPGSVPTAAQVAENGGIAALERSVSSSMPGDFTQRGLEQAAARVGALRGIAGDDATKAAAVAARKAATDPLYEQAKRATYTMDDGLQGILQTPIMQKALGKAQEMAANDGRKFSFSVDHPNAFGGVGIADRTSQQVTGQGLQDIKMAVDAMLSDPASGFAGKAGDQVRNLRGKLLDWMEGANPAFKAARTTYSEMSRPVNQMDVGQALLQKLEPALNDHGALASETANKFATALRNADQTTRTATGFKGASLDQVMEPQQLETLSAIAQDLARKSNAQNLGRGPGSNTFQNFAMDNLASQSGAPRVLGAAMNLPGVSKVSKFLYSGPEEKIRTAIAQAMLDPKSAGKLMNSAVARDMVAGRSVPKESLVDLLKSNPSLAAQLGGGAAGFSIGNYMAQ